MKMSCQLQAPAALPPEKCSPVSNKQEAECFPEQVWSQIETRSSVAKPPCRLTRTCPEMQLLPEQDNE